MLLAADMRSRPSFSSAILTSDVDAPKAYIRAAERCLSLPRCHRFERATIALCRRPLMTIPPALLCRATDDASDAAMLSRLIAIEALHEPA